MTTYIYYISHMLWIDYLTSDVIDSVRDYDRSQAIADIRYFTEQLADNEYVHVEYYEILDRENEEWCYSGEFVIKYGEEWDGKLP